MKKVRFLCSIFVFLIIFLHPLTIFACGGFETFTDPKKETHSSDDTKVFVSFKNGKETFVVEPEFSGDAKQFGVVLPFPAKPEIKEADMWFFDSLETLLNPKPVVFGALRGVQVDGSKGVNVVETKDVGDFETTTLTATSAEELMTWLKDHGYSYSSKDISNFDYYVQKSGYYFVALKVKLATFTGSLKPLSFTFDSSVPVLAMRISASEMKPMKYTLYTAGENMLFVPGTPVYASKKITKAEVQDFPIFKEFLAEGDWLTHAVVTMNPGAIEEDLVISEAIQGEAVSNKTIILNPESVPKEAGIVLGVSTTNKKTIAVRKLTPTPTMAPVTPTPTTMAMQHEDSTRQIQQVNPGSRKYTGVVFWVIIIVGFAVEAVAGALLFIFLRKK